jgi:O-antigen/teichoic acid export membrane protein
VAGWYGLPLLVPLIRLTSLALVIKGLSSPGRLLRDRQLEFRKPVLIGAAGQVVAIVLAIVLVLVVRNVYALVAYNLAFAAQQAIGSYLVHPFRPRLRFDGAKARELWRFGRGITASSVLIWLFVSGDRLVLGKMLGVSDLGNYDRASHWGNLPATSIAHVFSRLTFPAFARIKDRPWHLRRVYWRTMAFYAALALPVGLAIVLGAEPILGLLGKNYTKWEPALPALKIMAVYGASRALAGVNGSVLLAMGRSNWVAGLALVAVVVGGGLLWPLTEFWGTTGAALAVTVGAVAGHLGGWVLCQRLLRGGS